MFNKLLDHVRSQGVTVVSKEDSKFMRTLAKLMFFNKGFLTDYSTTIGTTVYLAARHWGSTEVLAHEYVHAYDAKKDGKVWFAIKYLLPQVLAVFSLLSVLAIAAIWWSPAIYFLTALGFLVFLAPIPSPTRSKIEFRGYKMSILILQRQGSELQVLVDWVTSTLDSAGYYYSGSRSIKKDLDKLVEEIEAGEVTGEPYREVMGVLYGGLGGPDEEVSD